MNKFLITTIMLFSSLSFGAVLYPKTVEELKSTSVRIYNLEMNSGGTGSIFRSYQNSTHILTNKHVCRLIEQGGVVKDAKGKDHLITHYKKYKSHDLCLVRIAVNMGINLRIADGLAQPSSKTIISGHPSLLPHIATAGHLSDNMNIKLMVGIRACTAKEIATDGATCFFFGGYPVLQTFDAQVTSNLIKPGNSGSAVFNADGEIVGVAFAGSGSGFSHAFIVPQTYLFYFLESAHRFSWVKVGTEVDDGIFTDRLFNFNKCLKIYINDNINPKIREYCDSANNLIWSK